MWMNSNGYLPYYYMGLSHGGKPGATPLNGAVSGGGSGHHRTTATVSPLTAPVSPASALQAPHQQSGFAAALRKLAKQAEGPPTGHDSSSLDPGGHESNGRHSPVTGGGHTKRSARHGKPGLTGDGAGLGSPPVVTIAPTVTKPSYVAGDRKGMERGPAGLMLDSLGLKAERDKMPSGGGGGLSRDDDRPRSKDSAVMNARLTPHSAYPPTVSSAGSTAPSDDVLSGSRGFQPYRSVSGDVSAAEAAALRHAAAATATSLQGMSPLDAYTAYFAHAQAAAAAAAGYPGAGYPGAHPAIRMDDPLLLERYRMMQSSALASPYALHYGAHPGLLSHAALSSYMDPRNPRYQADMLAQMYAYLGQATPTMPELSPGAAERLKEEEHRRLEREEREAREKEQRERQQQREKEEKSERERIAAEKASIASNAVASKDFADRRGLSGVGGSAALFSTERLLSSTSMGGAAGVATKSAGSLYGGSEPLNLKRYDDSKHLHLNGDARGAAEDSRAQLAAAAAAHNYRAALEASVRSPANSYLLASAAMPPLSVPKPHTAVSTASSSGTESTAPTFHRPFEATPSTAATSLVHHQPLNGYDPRVLADYEQRGRERDKLLADHRQAQELALAAAAAQKASLDLEKARNSSGGGLRASERLPSGDSSRAGTDLSLTGRDSSTRSISAPDQKGIPYGATGNSLRHSRPGSSISSGTVASKSSHVGGNSASSYSEASRNQQTDRHTPSKSHRQTLLQHDSGQKSGNQSNSAPHASNLPSTLSNLHNFSPAISSLSNMFKQESLLAGFGLETKVQPHHPQILPQSSGMAASSVAKETSAVGQSPCRANGAYAQSPQASRTRTHQIELSDKKRPRTTSGDYCTSVGGRISVNNHKTKAASPKKHGKSSTQAASKINQQDGSYEPPAKRAHLTSGVEAIDQPLSVKDSTRAQDYRQKREFLASLQLEPVPDEMKKENNYVQRVCAWDRDRREKLGGVPTAGTTVHNVSLPYEYSTTLLSQFIAAFSSPQKRKPSHVDPQQLSSKDLPSTPSVIANTGTIGQTTTTSSASPASSLTQAVNHPDGQPMKASMPSVSAQFVQQFHESVLEQTRQQRMNKPNAAKSQQLVHHGTEVRYSLISDSATDPSSSSAGSTSPANSHSQNNGSSSAVQPSSLQSMQAMTSQLFASLSENTKNSANSSNIAQSPSASAKSHQLNTLQSQPSKHSVVSTCSANEDTNDSQATNSGSVSLELKWPGMDAIVMAYHKHLQESQTEKQILREQHNLLEQQHRQLSRIAEQLSKRMEVLSQNKQQNEDERSKCQHKLDILRKNVSKLSNINFK